MSEYVGLVQGKVHDRREMSEYYCGGCGWPVTDHVSYCRECGGELHEGVDNSRWHELFGTPERAARTLEWNCQNQPACDYCIMADQLPDDKCGWPDALLEWLKQEVDA